MPLRFITILTLLISSSAYSKSKTNEDYSKSLTNESYVIEFKSKNEINILRSNPEISFDHPTKKTVEVYGPTGLGEYLKNLGIFHLPNEVNQKSVLGYPTPEEIEAKIIELTKKYPQITRLDKIGTSIQGRSIYSVKISDNPERDELEPEVKYIANMHGDEIVGRELMVLLIEELCAKYKSGDEKVKLLIDSTEIYIVPSMNPDGAINSRRGNSDWVDLNRDFPDFSTNDDENTPHGREVETKSIMSWQNTRNFSLSANFHGGAEVVNYPWDTVGDQHPLHAHVVKISKEYADIVPGMRDSTEFPGGIVNGYDWYEVNGGMQDWSYYWHNDLQVTIELSNTKWPRYSEVERYWNENKVALVEFLSKVHEGAGFKLNKKIKYISIEDNDTGELIGVFETKNNQFYKVLPSGNYSFKFLDQSKKTIYSIDKSINKIVKRNSYTVIQ